MDLKGEIRSCVIVEEYERTFTCHLHDPDRKSTRIHCPKKDSLGTSLVVQWSVIPLQGARVQFLIRELISHKPHSMASKFFLKDTFDQINLVDKYIILHPKQQKMHSSQAHMKIL